MYCIHPRDKPYINKPIEDHNLFKIICGNDQANKPRAVQFGDEIGTHMDDDVDPHRPS